MSEQQNEDGVVQLVDAGVPADQGLSSLGLLMQLAGNVLAAYAALMTFTMLFAMRGSGETLWVFLALGLSIARSLMQRSAGAELLYGSGQLHEDGKQSRMKGMRRYVIFGLAQSAAMAALLSTKFHVPTKIAAGVGVALALWPAALGILMQLPRFKRFQDDLPITEDKGFEGASILMTVLGTCGLVAAGTFLLFLLDLPGSALTKGPGVLVVLSLGMMCVRSVLHVQAGISGLRETSVDRSVELANRYANFGVISSFCAGGALLLAAMSSLMGGGDGVVLGLAVVCGLCWMLMTWPMIIRRFFSDRQFADLLAGDGAPIHRRAPDAGITGLGWLLFAHAMFSGAFVVIELVAADGIGGRGMRQLEALTLLGGTSGLRSVWWSVGLIVMQAWAGYELVRMSPQSRVIATLFGIIGTAVTLYINWPFIKMLKSMGGFMGKSEVLQLGPIAMALIIPVITVVLVNRKIAPTARARFRTKPAPQPPSA
jgi:hypothetical protein